MKVVVLYRVLQGWRVPVFAKLNGLEDVELMVLHGKSFPGTKVVNFSEATSFKHKELLTLGLNFPTRNGRAIMPINVSVLIELFKQSPDVIICEGASNLANNILAYLYKMIFRKKMIWWSLGEIKNREKSLLRKILESPINYMERRMDAIIAYSSFGARYFYRLGIDPKKIFVAVNVVDTDQSKERVSKLNVEEIYSDAHKDSRFNIIFVGAITKEKRLSVLLEAYQRLEAKYTDVHLTIVGDGEYLKECKDTAEGLKIKNISFPGRIVEGISNYFLGADIFVLPGLGGLAVSDALAHGVPVIASIADGCEKDLLGTGAGIIEEELSPEVLYHHLLNLYANPEVLKDMKVEALNVINSKYNISNYVQSIKNSIDFVLREDEKATKKN